MPHFALAPLPDLVERPELPEDEDDDTSLPRRRSSVIGQRPRVAAAVARPTSGLARQSSYVANPNSSASTSTGGGLARQPSSLGRTGSGFYEGGMAAATARAVGGQGVESGATTTTTTASSQSLFLHPARHSGEFASGLLAIPGAAPAPAASSSSSTVTTLDPTASPSAQQPMMIPRSRRHSFAEHGETLVAASTAAEQSNNTSTNGSRIDLSGGRPAIKVGDDGRPNPRHLNSTNQAKMSFSGIPRTTTTTKLNANNHSTTTTAILESGATPDFDAASATTTNVSDHHNSPNHNNNNNNNATTTTTHRAASQSLITPSLATYDPYPATWPTRDDVRRARRMVGVEAPEKDEWSRMGVRFGRVRKTKLGPGTYTPLSRGTLDPHSPHAHLSTVPRFPSLPHNPAVGPGSYCVDRVPCTPGFKPWIMTLVPLSWRPPAVAKCGAAGGNALEGDYEDRIEDFAAARRKVLCAQHNTQHPILSDTPLLLPIPSSAKSTPPPPPQQSPTTTTTTTRQGGGGEGGKGMHVFSAAFLVAPPPRPVILLTS